MLRYRSIKPNTARIQILIDPKNTEPNTHLLALLMVSQLQAAAALFSKSTLQGKNNSIQRPISNDGGANNKRKREVDDRKDEEEELVLWRLSTKKSAKARRPLAGVDNLELHLEDTPTLPPEWQRCLDIKSGKMYFYNSRTRTTTCRDPTVGIDLDLNLGWNEIKVKDEEFEEEEEEEKPKICIEMAATVCIRCHMLVMICRSSPSCPNCKFVQSPGLQLLDCNLRCLG